MALCDTCMKALKEAHGNIKCDLTFDGDWTRLNYKFTYKGQTYDISVSFYDNKALHLLPSDKLVIVDVSKEMYVKNIGNLLNIFNAEPTPVTYYHDRKKLHLKYTCDSTSGMAMIKRLFVRAANCAVQTFYLLEQCDGVHDSVCKPTDNLVEGIEFIRG